MTIDDPLDPAIAAAAADLEAQLEALFTGWKAARGYGSEFAHDGALDPAAYLAEVPRILFILKEPSTSNYQLAGGLLGWLKSPGAKYGSTWNVLARWAGYLLGDPIPTVSSGKRLRQQALARLRRVAVLNLKKVGPRRRTDHLELAAHAAYDSEFIREQIQILRPDVIVGCGVAAELVWLLNVRPNELPATSGVEQMPAILRVVRPDQVLLLVRHPGVGASGSLGLELRRTLALALPEPERDDLETPDEVGSTLKTASSLHDAVLGIRQPLSVILIEDEENVRDGTTAETSLRRSAESVDACFEALRFSDKKSFVKCLRIAVGRAISSTLLLVISAHGEEATGTRIAAKGETFSVADVMHEVPQRPSTMTIFLSMCWGAYPEIPTAFRCRSDPAPLVVGAIVAVEPGDANRFQHELVTVFASRENDTKVVDLVVESNKRLLTAYHGLHAFAVVTRDGRRIPKWGTNGFAGTRLPNLSLKILAHQRSARLVRAQLDPVVGTAGSIRMRIEVSDGEPDVVVAEDARKQLWLMKAAALIQADGPVPVVGQRLTLTATRTGEPTDREPVGGLVDIADIKLGEVKGVQHKFGHAIGPLGSIEGETRLHTCPRPCLTCRWCALGWTARNVGPEGRVEAPEQFVICTKRRGDCRLQGL